MLRLNRMSQDPTTPDCFYVGFAIPSSWITPPPLLALPAILRRYATDRGIYLSELSRKLTELKPNARVITIDKRLQGPFNLISWVVIIQLSNDREACGQGGGVTYPNYWGGEGDVSPEQRHPLGNPPFHPLGILIRELSHLPQLA